MNNDEMNSEVKEAELPTSQSGGFNPHFAALLEHIGRMIAKDMIEKAKRNPEPGEKDD